MSGGTCPRGCCLVAFVRGQMHGGSCPGEAPVLRSHWHVGIVCLIEIYINSVS